jgi:hypothetical protein
MKPISTRSGFLTVTDLNDFNCPAQTTNLGLAESVFLSQAKFTSLASGYLGRFRIPGQDIAERQPSSRDSRRGLHKAVEIQALANLGNLSRIGMGHRKLRHFLRAATGTSIVGTGSFVADMAEQRGDDG